MIILKDECKKIGVSVGDFIKTVPVPAQTLRDWCQSKPDLVFYLLSTFNGSSKNTNTVFLNESSELNDLLERIVESAICTRTLLNTVISRSDAYAIIDILTNKEPQFREPVLSTVVLNDGFSYNMWDFQ